MLPRCLKCIGLFVENALAIVACMLTFLCSKILISVFSFIENAFVSTKLRLSFFGIVLIGVLFLVSILLISIRLPRIHIEIVAGTGLLFLMLLYSGLRLLRTPSTLSEIQDVAGVSCMENWVKKRISNSYDIIWFRLLVVLSLLIIPAFLGILVPNLYSGYSVLMYAIVFTFTLSKVNAIDHTNSHNHLFRSRRLVTKKDKFLFLAFEMYFMYVFNFMFSRIPNWYKIQHVIIHHVENNGMDDTQSTLKYHRASFVDFARCANRFAISGLISYDVIMYLIRKGRKEALLNLLLGIFVFYVAIGLIALWNFKAAITILIFRYVGQLVASLGFFQEHGMIDTSTPSNIYRNALHFISTGNSHASLGDDAHIEHHLHQSKHWSEYAKQSNRSHLKYESEKVLGLTDIPGGQGKYYQYLWKQDYTKLAQYFIVFGHPEASINDIAVLIEERVRPIDTKDKEIGSFAHFTGVFASYLLPSWP